MEIVSNNPIDPDKAYECIKKHTAGSVVLHFAVVRPISENKTTDSVAFHADGDVDEELHTISEDIRKKGGAENLHWRSRTGHSKAGKSKDVK